MGMGASEVEWERWRRVVGVWESLILELVVHGERFLTSATTDHQDSAQQ